MKRFSPADPAAFKPLEFPRLSPQQWRNKAFKQPALLALPPPDKLARVLSGLLVFMVLL